MLLFKLVISPVLMCVATLISRRFGPSIGGLFMAMPLLAGPISFFLCIEQGPIFAVEAAKNAILGYGAIVVCGVGYLRFARSLHWEIPVLVGSVIYLMTVKGLGMLGLNSNEAFGMTLVLLVLGFIFLPKGEKSSVTTRRPCWDMPLRALLAAGIVLAVTELSELLGPDWSGYFSTYPSFTFVMASFILIQSGYVAVLYYWHGFTIGLVGSVIFFYILIILLPVCPVWSAYAGAIGANCLFNLLVFLLDKRRAVR